MIESSDFTFYRELFAKYIHVDIPIEHEGISRIDDHIMWYLADSSKSFISSKTITNQIIVEIDIKQAFPSICKLLYYNNKEFINKIDSFDNKFDRNKFIAVTLHNNEFTKNDLRKFQIICKMIILGILFENKSDDIIIFEIKKDGLIALVSKNDYLRLIELENYGGEFSKFIINNGFKLMTSTYKKYIRSNKTSWYINDNTLEIKGMYNKIPKFLKNISNEYILNEQLDMEFISNIYSKKYIDIIQKTNSFDLLQKYYYCEDKNSLKPIILNNNNEYELYTINSNIDPLLYLQTFLFPLILSTKIEY